MPLSARLLPVTCLLAAAVAVVCLGGAASAQESEPATSTLMPTSTPVLLATNTPAGNWVNVGEEGAFLRAGPGQRFEVMGYLDGGALVEPVSRDIDNGWVLIRREDGFAWIARTLVQWTINPMSLPVMVPGALTPSSTPGTTRQSTRTPTLTPTPTRTLSPTASRTATLTASHTVSSTRQPTRTPSRTATRTAAPSSTQTLAPTETPSYTRTSRPTDTAAPIASAAVQASPTRTPTPSRTRVTASATASLTHTASSTRQPTRTPTATSGTPTRTPTTSPVPPSATPTNAATLIPVDQAATATRIVLETAVFNSRVTQTAQAVEQAATPSQTATLPAVLPATADIASPTAEATALVTGDAASPTPLPTLTPVDAVGETAESARAPLEAIVAVAALSLVFTYIAYYWRGASRAERYSGGFLIERCPACEKGTLSAETRMTRILGIPRPTHTIRCDNCRSVLREVGEGEWRYAVDPVVNQPLYQKWNNKVIRSEQLAKLNAVSALKSMRKDDESAG